MLSTDMGFFYERVHIEPYRVTVAQFRSPNAYALTNPLPECCEVKVFTTAAGGVSCNGDYLVLREAQSAGGGDARQPFLPKFHLL